MIHPLHALASAVRRAVHALRCPTLTGHDPMPMLGRGEYYLSIGRRGWRYGYQFKVSRGDMELLSEALTSLLAEADFEVLSRDILAAPDQPEETS